MRKTLVTLDILLILMTATPAAALLWECFNSAINGVIPFGGKYGLDYGQFIYGPEAFIYTMMFYMYFLFFLVIIWSVLFCFTAVFTGLTVSYLKEKRAVKAQRA